MKVSPTGRPGGGAGLLRRVFHDCRQIASRIDRRMDGLRRARGCDRADLAALHADLQALGRALGHLEACVSPGPGRPPRGRDRALRRALSWWLRDAARVVDWMSAGIEPGFDLPGGDGVDWWEVWLDGLELADRMENLRRHLRPGRTPHPGQGNAR